MTIEVYEPDEIIPPMNEEVKEAIVEVKGILRDLAITTFHKYREAGQTILDSGYEKRPGKQNLWSKEILDYACLTWGCSRRTTYRFIEWGEMSQETFDMACQRFRSLYDYYNQPKGLPAPEFGFDIYNVWKVAQLDPDQERYPGQTPKAIIKNLIYYYSDAGDKVLDPMAGSGITGTVCKEMGRQALLYDIQPINESIQENDILQGLPEEARDTNLVILDPPYYNLLAEDYPENAFTESYESFLEAVERTLRNLVYILASSGKVAIILKPMNVEMVAGKWLDMTFDCVEIAKGLGYSLHKRICAPLSTQQFQAHNVNQAKERRVMLNTLRDIIILER